MQGRHGVHHRHGCVHGAIDIRLRLAHGLVDRAIDFGLRFDHGLADGAVDVRADADIYREREPRMIVALAPPSALRLRPRLARAPQRDGPAERFELDVRAAVAQGHREPLVALLRSIAPEREGRSEPAVVGAHHQRCVDLLRNGHRNQAVVRRQAVQPFVPDGAVVRDVAVDRVEIDVAGVDAVEDDAAVGRFGGEVDAFVQRAHFDAPFRFLQRDFPLHGFQRHEARAAAHLDVASRGFDSDVAADAVHRYVGIRAADADGHPFRHADRVVERAGRTAAHRPRPDRQYLIARLDVDDFAIRVRRLDAHGVLVPHLDGDITGEVVDVELGALGDLHRLIGRRDDRHRENDLSQHGRSS